MRINDIIERATDFGTSHSRDFFSFTLKNLIYIITAVILGNFTDNIIKKAQEHKVLGDNTIYYILLQTFIIIVTKYMFLVYLFDFISEFQITIPGSYYIVMYFGMQTNYFHMIKEYMNR